MANFCVIWICENVEKLERETNPTLRYLLNEQICLTVSETKFFAAQIQIPIPNKYLNIWDVYIKAYFFVRNNGRIMGNMDKGLTVPV